MTKKEMRVMFRLYCFQLPIFFRLLSSYVDIARANNRELHIIDFYIFDIFDLSLRLDLKF